MNILAVATSDYIGFMLLVAMLISSKIRRADAGHFEYKIFTAITILTMIACVVDFLVFFVDGKSGILMRIINMAGNTFCFMANPIFIASWCIYEDLKLYHSMTRIKKIYTYAFDLRPHLYTMLEANGFVREATLKDHCCFEGKYKDVVLHSFINDQYDIVNYVNCTQEQHLEILNLRNLDDVRKWMVNPEVISEENHFQFVERLKENPDRLYFAIYKDGLLVGTYNLTKEKDGVWERGIIANPNTKIKGETAKWEGIILADLSKQGIKTVTAKVKQDNPRSIKYHEKLGYKEQSRDNEYIYYILRLQ